MHCCELVQRFPCTCSEQLYSNGGNYQLKLNKQIMQAIELHHPQMHLQLHTDYQCTMYVIILYTLLNSYRTQANIREYDGSGTHRYTSIMKFTITIVVMQWPQISHALCCVSTRMLQRINIVRKLVHVHTCCNEKFSVLLGDRVVYSFSLVDYCYCKSLRQPVACRPYPAN